jgi:hypothetical protein
MTDTPAIPNEDETFACFVIASEARQSSLLASALVGQSGLLRRSAPRNDAAGLMADAVAIPNEAETRASFVIPAQAGTQMGPIFGRLRAFFVKGLGPDLRRDYGGVWDAGVALRDGGVCG